MATLTTPLLFLLLSLVHIASSQSASWCVPKPDASEKALQGNIDYACNQGIDCTPINPGGVCFDPNTVQSHAAYAMNLYYQHAGKAPKSCDFANTGKTITTDPSYNKCIYPGGEKSLN